MLTIGAIQVQQSPDLPTLAAALRAHVQVLRLDQRRFPPLKPITIVVPDLAIARFLHDQAAIVDGIGAGLRYQLLGEWLENEYLAQAEIDDEAVSSVWPPHALYLTILAVLSEQQSLPDLPAAARAESVAVQAQFAGKMTQVYHDYLRYRPDWLSDWQQGDSSAEHWQAVLWRAVVQRLGPIHRAEVVRKLTSSAALADRTQQTANATEPSLLFGFSHLPPAVVELLRQRAMGAPVYLYFANPCVEYWADLRCQTALRAPMEDPEFQIDIGHPLLRAWGAHGQAFFRLLLDATDSFYNLAPALQADRDHDLSRLQQSLHHLDHDIALVGDRTIQVHNANNVSDELLQIKRAIFAALNDFPDLQLEDIVVLCPNLPRYRPHIGGCWSADETSNDARTASLAFSIWAEGDQDQHPWLHILLQLIRADRMRFDRSDIEALLAFESVRAAYQLDHDDAYVLDELLAELSIGFGLDDRHRAAVIQKNFDTNDAALAGFAAIDNSALTWQRQLQRLVLGYVQGARADAAEGTGSVASSLRLSPRYAHVLGAIGELISDLRRFVRQLSVPRNIAQWCALLYPYFAKWSAVRFDATRACQVGEREFAAFGQFQTALLQFEAAAAAAQLQAPVPAELVFRFMTIALRDVGRDRDARFGSQLVRGGVCVSAMVPMRSRPFRVVCILGANAEDFPRAENPSDWQLAQANPRLGDRYIAQDDRYLFLEAINAAHDRLIMSYQASSPIDGETLKPAMMVQQLVEFLQARGWQSPTSMANATPSAIDTSAAPPSVMPQALNTLSKPAPRIARVVDLAELIRYWKAPNDSYAERVLNLRYRRERIDRQRDEVLQLDLAVAPSAHRRTMKMRMQLTELPAEAPGFLQAMNVIPQGENGRQAYQNLRLAHESLFDNLVQKLPSLDCHRSASDLAAKNLMTVYVDCQVSLPEAELPVRLMGSVRNVWPEARAAWMGKLSEVSVYDLIEARLVAAALDQTAPSDQAWRVYLTSIKKNSMIVVSGFGLRLEDCLDHYQNHGAPIWFWPSLAQAYVKAYAPRGASNLASPEAQWAAQQNLLDLVRDKGFDSRVAELLFTDRDPQLDPRIRQFVDLSQMFFAQGVL